MTYLGTPEQRARSRQLYREKAEGRPPGRPRLTDEVRRARLRATLEQLEQRAAAQRERLLTMLHSLEEQGAPECC